MKTLGTMIVVALSVASVGVWAAPTYELENEVVLQADATSGMMYPIWSHDGLKIAYIAVTPSGTEIRVANLITSPPTVTTVVSTAANAEIRQSTIAWSPSDQYILFLSRKGAHATIDQNFIAKCSATDLNQVTYEVLRPDQFLEVGSHVVGFNDPWISIDGAEATLFIPVIDFDTTGGVNGIYGMSISESGVPNVATAKMIVQGEYGNVFQQISGSPSGNGMLVNQPAWSPTNRDNWLVDDIQAIMQGGTAATIPGSPPWTPTDIRVKKVDLTTTYLFRPTFSQDGSLIFYAEDVNGLFNETQGNYGDADFDVVIVKTADVLAGSPQPVYLSALGNQGMSAASEGGTRIASVDHQPSTGGKVSAFTMRVSDTILLDGSEITTEEFRLEDGAGTTLVVFDETECGNLGTGAQTIFVYTPISPVDEAQLLDGVTGIPAVRAFGHVEHVGDAVTFNPPAQLTISYRDAEIRNLPIPESELRMFMYNESTELYDLEVPIEESGRDLVNNTLTAQISSLSITGAGEKKAKTGMTGASIIIGVPLDSDNDGIPDVDDAFPYDADYHLDVDGDSIADEWETFWFGPIAEPGEDPLVLCSPDGDPDGDGLSNLREFQSRGLGLSPLEPNELPVTNPMLLSLTALLIVIGAVRCGRLQQNKAE